MKSVAKKEGRRDKESGWRESRRGDGANELIRVEVGEFLACLGDELGRAYILLSRAIYRGAVCSALCSVSKACPFELVPVERATGSETALRRRLEVEAFDERAVGAPGGARVGDPSTRRRPPRLQSTVAQVRLVSAGDGANDIDLAAHALLACRWPRHVLPLGHPRGRRAR